MGTCIGINNQNVCTPFPVDSSNDFKVTRFANVKLRVGDAVGLGGTSFCTAGIQDLGWVQVACTTKSMALADPEHAYVTPMATKSSI